MAETICPHCGAYDSEHNYEHMARECYPKQIEQLQAALKELIESETDSARVHYGRYDRRSKSYIFNDDIWRESHEASFLMVRRAKAALGNEQNGDDK